MQGAASAEQRQPMRRRYRVCLVDLIRHVMRAKKFACSHIYAKRCRITSAPVGYRTQKHLLLKLIMKQVSKKGNVISQDIILFVSHPFEKGFVKEWTWVVDLKFLIVACRILVDAS
jgi:hypothetical protein